MRVLNQIGAVTAINLRSIPQRFWISLSTIVAVALMVTVLLSFLAMANGFQQTLRGAGSDNVALLLRGGAGAEINSGVSREQMRLIEEAPGVVRNDAGAPLVSGEFYIVVDGLKKATNTKANLALRGIGAEGQAIRDGFSIVEGRMFEPGAAEIVVGQSLLKEFAGFELGNSIKLGTGTWTVVGVFEMDGTVFESELWADIGTVQSLFRRGNVFQSIRVRLDSPERLAELTAYVDADPRLKLDVKSERRYFADQAAGTGGFIQQLGWPLGILMALGALAGALNTMYTSVASRGAEIATLRALGFGGFPAFVGTLVESLVLSVIGGIVGAGVVWIFFNVIGFTASTFGGSFTQVVFAFQLTPALAAQGVMLAFIVGLIGGLFPAIRAARIPIILAFQKV